MYPRKSITIHLILTGFFLLVANYSTGQNTGPLSPETHSFEPAESSSLVDPLTGDLTYVLPLLTVPGPEGGYPIVASYHSGVAVDQESSWVGLGWNVNVGAINRYVNVTPDDSKNYLSSTIVTDFPFTKRRISGGLNVNAYGISLGVGFNWQDGKGFTSMSFNGGIEQASGSLTIGDEVGIGVSAKGYSIGISNRSFKASGGTPIGSIAISNYGASIGNGIKGVNGRIGIDSRVGLHGSLGVSIGMAGMNVSMSSAGTSINGTGIMTAFQRNIQPVLKSDYSKRTIQRNENYNFYFASMRYQEIQHKFSLRNINTVFRQGVLYSNETQQDVPLSGGRQSTTVSMDAYKGMFDHNEPHDQNRQELSPAYEMLAMDQFTVSGQGINGSFKARIAENAHVFTQGRIVNAFEDNQGDPFTLEDEVIYYGNTRTFDNGKDKIHFYFDGTNTGHLKAKESTVSSLGSTTSSNPLDGLDNALTSQQLDITAGTESAYNASIHRTENGEYISYYTNDEIVNDPSDIIDAYPIMDRSDAGSFDPDGIGAFSIVKKDGMRYNYSIPVYQFEKMGWDRIDNESSSKTQFIDFGMFAYTWLLTSVTGPDFVDNGNGYPDEEDYGYWVRFDYGKWTDSYIWMTPTSLGSESQAGMESDEEEYEIDGVDHLRKTFGRKQIYYLNSVKTRSHTALFVKSLREDGLGAKVNYSDGGPVLSLDDIDNNDDEEVILASEVIDLLERSSKSQPADWWTTNECGSTLYPNSLVPDLEAYFDPNSSNAELRGSQRKLSVIQNFKCTFNENHKILKLDRIYLLSNKDFNDIIPQNYLANEEHDLVALTNRGEGVVSMTTHVYGDCDLADSNILSGDFDEQGDQELAYVLSPIFSKFEKTITGHLQENVLDDQDLDWTSIEARAIKVIDFNQEQSAFDPGADGYSLGVSDNSAANGRLTLYGIEVKGKNADPILPPYEFDYHYADNGVWPFDSQDSWGFYTGCQEERVNDISCKKEHVKHWNLKSITGPYGSELEIDYESDSYSREAAINYSGNQSEIIDRFKVNKFKKLSSTKIELHFKNPLIDPSSWFEVGGNYKVLLTSFFGGGLPVAGEGKIGSCTNLDPNGNWIQIDFGVCDDINDPNPCFLSGIASNTTFDIIRDVVEEANEAYVETPGLNRERWGGGLRVSTISLRSATSDLNYTTEYDYENKFGITSGVTMYRPTYEDEIRYIPYIHELPGPSVIYGEVTEKTFGEDDSLLGQTKYFFNTYAQTSDTESREFEISNQIKITLKQDNVDLGAVTGPGQIPDTKKAHSYLIEKSLAQVGQPSRIASFNSVGELLGETAYEYNSDLDEDRIGVFQESFFTVKRVFQRETNDNDPGHSDYHVINSSRIEYPSVITSERNFSDGLEVKTEYLDFDIVSGQPTKVKSANSYGEEFTIESTPAFEYFPEMGSMVEDQSNANMLTQIAASKSSKVTSSGTEVISAGVEIWDDEWSYREYSESNDDFSNVLETDPARKVWRKKEIHNWQGKVNVDGALINHEDFNFTIPGNSNSAWVKQSTVKSYDRNSNVIESGNVAGKLSTQKIGYGGHYASVVCATNQQGIAFSGAEDPSGNGDFFYGEISGVSNRYETARYAHTGNHALHLRPNESGFVYDVPSVDEAPDASGVIRDSYYRASVWLHDENHGNGEMYIELWDDATLVSTTTIDQNSDMVIQAGMWHKLDTDIRILPSIDRVVVGVRNTGGSESGDVFFDDFRFHPINSPMTSYVYDEDTGLLTAILNNDNMATKYYYDSAGRLIKVEEEIADQGFVKRSDNRYNYGRMN